MASTGVSRIRFLSLNVFVAICLLASVSCSDDNKPSVNNETGGKTASAAGAGGSSSGTGGSKSTATGGSTAAAGGSTSSGGAAGASGTSGASTGPGTPHCDAVPLTAAGMAPAKNGTCTDADPQLCYKACGPETKKYIGYKAETCTNGAYVEDSGCTFPASANYACYKIPAKLDSTCPAAAPQASEPCEVATCVVCNFGGTDGLTGGKYKTSSGEEKEGFCVCPEAGSSGSRSWSCASTTAWPCPAGQGC